MAPVLEEGFPLIPIETWERIRAHLRLIRIVFHHFPLQNRGHSQTAAIAVECAFEQGVFDRMYTSLYQYQDSIGAVGWNWFAYRSAVPDLEAFEDCVRRPVEEFPRIGQGRSVGLASGVRGTPTVWLNGEPIAVPSVASFSARVISTPV